MYVDAARNTGIIRRADGSVALGTSAEGMRMWSVRKTLTGNQTDYQSPQEKQESPNPFDQLPW
jgi:hypothetical protein